MTRSGIHNTGRPWPYDRVARMELAGGDRGTRQTLDAMAVLVRDAATRPDVRTAAIRVIIRSGQPSPLLMLGRLFRYLETVVEFKADPKGQELIRHPSQLLAEITAAGVALGDCDDRAILGASMLRVVGLPVAFVVIGRDPWADMEHVYIAARVGGRWIPLDPQELDEPGREVPHARRWLYPIV